jgi:hypothetical protein
MLLGFVSKRELFPLIYEKNQPEVCRLAKISRATVYQKQIIRMQN